jgi:hypothetical protein
LPELLKTASGDITEARRQGRLGMELIDPISGKVIWSSASGLPIPGPRPDGQPYVQRGADAPVAPRRGVLDFFAPQAGQDRRKALNKGLGYLVPPELRGLLSLGEMVNPVAGAERAAGASQRMLAPGASGWDRARAGGDMALELAGIVGPAAAARYAGRPAAEALQEGLLGFTNAADAFAADEFGGLRVWTGGAGDPIKAAADRGAWFSEAPDLAKEYAGQNGRVLAAEIEPSRPISFRHAEQRRTIGDVISTALDGAKESADFDAARGIVDRLVARYGDDQRPLFEFWNSDKDVTDLFRALGYDAISAAEKADMKSATWAALDPSIVKMVDAEQAMAGQQQRPRGLLSPQ